MEMNILIKSEWKPFTNSKGSGKVLRQTLILNGMFYELNYFTNGSPWIKAMKISKDGTKLTIYIDVDWFGGEIAPASIIFLLRKECILNQVKFPSQILFRFVPDNYEFKYK